MFGLSMAEVVVIAVVALVVLGPEKLPTIIKQAAKGYRKLSAIRTEFSKALTENFGQEAETLKQTAQSLKPEAQTLKAEAAKLQELANSPVNLEKKLGLPLVPPSAPQSQPNAADSEAPSPEQTVSESN
ncbi:MAG: twin-arginine translocase TatA/TatE family subunit [Deltaproteobacteria bacterium]|jgi:sec-independent protein translocase protein TatB|nr:twin-arginine translocase TatA/TatE family subunit [Deltaproteobacteria bacterium]